MKTAVLDIGGTAIKSGIFENSQLHNTQETPSEAHLGGKQVLANAYKIIEDLGKVDAIGISTTGQVDVAQGMVRESGNIPDFTGFEMRRTFYEKFGVPVYVDNDGNAATIGEAAFGAGKGVSDFLCLTYGTGIGGAIVLGGKVFTGSSFSAGEFGQLITHSSEQTEPGGPGYYERYASATKLVQNTNAIRPDITTGVQVFDNLSDPNVQAVVDSWIHEVMCGLAGIIHIFNPTLIVLGGGIMQAGYVLPALRAKISNYVVPGMRNVTLAPALLGNDAGLWGMGWTAQSNQ